MRRVALGPALAVMLLVTACAPTTARPRPFPLPEPDRADKTTPRPDEEAALPSAPPHVPPASDAESGLVPSTTTRLVQTALGLRGAPYLDGGSTPNGFDCSGFTQYVFALHGWRLPRAVERQVQAGHPVGRGALQPGDLLFFATVSNRASHVAISLGGDQFVHAPSERGMVRVDTLTRPYWSARFLQARRISDVQDW